VSKLARPTARSRALYELARDVMPGGVSSPVRAYRAVGGEPPFIARGEGARLYDADGNSYLDYVASWGPLILGHAHPAVVSALRLVAAQGTSFGAPTESEVTLAQMVRAKMPSLEQIRFVNSGTEATMSALRLARGLTGRAKIIKMDGGYHGHADSLLAAAGSGALTFSLPGSAGVSPALVTDTVVVPFNDLEATERALAANRGQVAALIVEPVAANMGVVAPLPGYLEGLRDLTRQAGTLLIFDEVVTGFRVARGGAQERYGVTPDLTCLGKVLGGGLPVGAYGGSRQLMAALAPDGPVYQAGTLSGNPLTMAAGIATLSAIPPGAYAQLEAGGLRLAQALRELAGGARIPLQVNQVGSMFTAFFAEQPVRDAASARAADQSRYRDFFHASLESGVYLPPSQFEACFVSLAHQPEDLAATVAIWEQVFSTGP
jgi:glutamate-1-semialdehyde 2,1-aminomutase